MPVDAPSMRLRAAYHFPMSTSGALRRRFTRSTAALVVACVAGGLLGAGCSGSTSSPAPRTPTTGSASTAPTSGTTVSQGAGSSGQNAAGCKVGFALDNYGPERYPNWDGPPIEQLLGQEGVSYTMSDAKGNAETQESQVDAFVAAGTDVIILKPFTSGSSEYNGNVPAAVKKATDAGVRVISYDLFLESPDVLYIAFDWVEAGRMQARAILAARPKGNYVIIDGDADSPEAQMMRRGIGEVLQPAIDSGAIKIVAESYTHWWDPTVAEATMDAILQKNANKIDAVVAEADGLAAGAIKSLTGAGVAGKVAVSSVAGLGGFPDAVTFNAIARGVQTVDVWQDYRRLGKAAAEAAVQLCRDRDMAKVRGTARFATPGGNQLTSILLTSQPITKDNLSVILDTGWLKKDDICLDVDPATAPAACR